MFVIVHAIFYGCDGTFDDQTLHFWQFIDPILLKTRLIESVWYLHIQPPLFNFFVGLVLQLGQSISEKGSYCLFFAVYLLLGITSLFSVFYLQKRFQISNWIATSTTCLCLITPSWVLYEHWLMYTFPILALLVFSALSLHAFLSQRTRFTGAMFFVCVVCLIYLRSVFHWTWFIAVVMLLVPHFWTDKRRLLSILIVPTVLVFSLFVKNWVLFDTFSSSTWLGPNVYLMLWPPPQDVQRELILQSRLSPFSYVHPFSPLERYHRYPGIDPAGIIGIPVLDQAKKSDGTTNFNHHLYVTINRHYLDDAKAIVQKRPDLYFNAVRQSYQRFCQPAWNYRFFVGQSPEFWEHIAVWNHYTLGWEIENFRQEFEYATDYPKPNALNWLLPLGWLIGIVFIALPESWSRLTFVDRTVLGYCCVTIALVAVAGICFMKVENFRLRFVLTPLHMLLLGLIMDRTIGWVNNRRKFF